MSFTQFWLSNYFNNIPKPVHTDMEEQNQHDELFPNVWEEQKIRLIDYLYKLAWNNVVLN